MRISTAILCLELPKNEGLLVIPPNGSGLVYKLKTATQQLFSDPDGYIAENKLTPLFKLGWSTVHNEGRGGAIAKRCNTEGVIDNSLSIIGFTALQKKAEKLINSNLKYAVDFFTFFDQDSLELMAKNNLIRVHEDITEATAASMVPQFLADWRKASNTGMAKFAASYDVSAIPLVAEAVADTAKAVKSVAKAVTTAKKAKASAK